jgi:folate-binding protein YgfZ
MAPNPLSDVHASAGATSVDIDGSPVVDRYPGALDRVLGGSEAMCVDLSHVPTFRLVGDDVRRWTNGMFTNNTRRLQPGQGNRHCACDDRGRVRGVLDLYFVASDTVRIVLDGITEEAFLERYQMYLLLDDIEVEEDEPAVSIVTVQGEVGSVLEALGLPLPEDAHAHEAASGDWEGIRVCRKDRTGLGGVDLVVSHDKLAALWAALVAQGVRPGGASDLDTLRVVAGRVGYPVDATDKSMVHELRLNEECCAFDKGCYVGQEVINRIDVRGAIQKRITRLVLDEAAPLGAEVRLGEKRMGTLSSLATYGGRELGLGVLRKAVWEDGTELVVSDGAEGWIRAVVSEFTAGT